MGAHLHYGRNGCKVEFAFGQRNFENKEEYRLREVIRETNGGNPARRIL